MPSNTPEVGAGKPPTEAALLDVSKAWDAEAARRFAATRELPLDVKRAAVSGFGVAALVGAGAAATTLILARATAPETSALWQGLWPRYLWTLGPIVALDLGLLAITRMKTASLDVVLRLGLAHFVGVAFLLGLFRHTHAWPAGEALRQWSPIAVWILLIGALVPLRPGTILGWSFLAALMDPFALLTQKERLAPESTWEALLVVLTPFLAAVMAYATSSVVHGLSERVAKAREFGSYRLVERLGRGGMAEVWRADHHLLARPAAVKLIRPGVLEGYGEKESQRLVRLFEREAQSTAALRSPHTIQLYDFGVARDGTFYYVMELLDGFDLQTLVERFGRQPPERVAHVLRQVCHSLREAHAAHLVHRDLKPGNIYVCRYGADFDVAKVLDFGLVLDRRPTAEELDGHRGQIGTPAVMAPEMIRFGAPVDQRSDLYGIGCVAYWMLTGARVFEAESRNDMLVMHAHQRPVLPSRRVHADIHAGLEALVMRCLVKNPDLRPQSAEELSDALSALTFETPWTPLRAKEWWASQ